MCDSYFLYVLLSAFSLATYILPSFKQSGCLAFNVRVLVPKDYKFTAMCIVVDFQEESFIDVI